MNPSCEHRVMPTGTLSEGTDFRLFFRISRYAQTRRSAVTVLHIAWLRFSPGVSSDRISQHLEACRALVGRVPVVKDLQCGATLSDRAGGLTHGIVVTLPNHDALPAYLEHPAHIPVATALKADVAELRVMDLEV